MLISSIFKNLYQLESQQQFQKKNFKIYLVFGFIGSIIGYKFGYRYCDNEDYQQYIQQFESEEQQMKLIQDSNKPILQFFYTPGDQISFYLRKNFLKASKLYFKECHFMKINCAQNFELCQKRDLKRIPHLELMKQSTEKIGQFDFIRSTYDYNEDGISSFLENNQVIPKFKYQNIYNNQSLNVVKLAMDLPLQ